MLFNTTQGYDSVNKRNTSSQLRFITKVVCVFLRASTVDAELKKKRKMNLTSNNISCNEFLRYSPAFFQNSLGS